MSFNMQSLQASHKLLNIFEQVNFRTENIIDNLSGLFLIINEKNEILRANKNLAKIFNMRFEQILRLNFSTGFQKENWNIFEHNLDMIRNKKEEKLSFELCLIDKGDNSHIKPYLWQLSQFSTKSKNEGNLITILGNDISSLRESEKKLMNIFSSTPLGIMIINSEGLIEESHSNYLKVLLERNTFSNISLKKALFEPVMHKLSDEDKKGIDDIFKSLKKEELLYDILSQNFPRQIFFPSKSGEREGRWIKITYKPIVYEGIVENLLLILEDKTPIINAAKLKERADLIEKQSKAVYESAIHDPLTNLYTRLYMKDVVKVLIHSHNRKLLPNLSLIFIDLDKFKQINDTYGHNEGDNVLSKIGEIILRQGRKNDIPIRYGGEEFLIFVPTDSKGANIQAERIRKEFEKTPFIINNKKIFVTLSAGTALHRVEESLESLIERADNYLYQAKESGRNCCLYEKIIKKNN